MYLSLSGQPLFIDNAVHTNIQSAQAAWQTFGDPGNADNSQYDLIGDDQFHREVELLFEGNDGVFAKSDFDQIRVMRDEFKTRLEVAAP